MAAYRATAMSLFLLAVLAGCSSMPTAEIDRLREQNRALVEKSKASAAQIEGLAIHTRSIQEQLRRTEEELALASERSGLQGSQLANYQRERDLQTQFRSAAQSPGMIPSAESARLAALAQRYPSLRFDPRTGIAKLDTDILFDDGASVLKPGAEKALSELVTWLSAPEGRDLRVLVVGHTDDRSLAGKPVRDEHGDNFGLSADRALAVSAELRRLGLAEQRVGVAGFGRTSPWPPTSRRWIVRKTAAWNCSSWRPKSRSWAGRKPRRVCTDGEAGVVGARREVSGGARCTDRAEGEPPAVFLSFPLVKRYNPGRTSCRIPGRCAHAPG